MSRKMKPSRNFQHEAKAEQMVSNEEGSAITQKGFTKYEVELQVWGQEEIRFHYSDIIRTFSTVFHLSF
jgi:hypothetical protein